MKIYRTQRGIVAETNGSCYALENTDWDDFTTRDDIGGAVRERIDNAEPLSTPFSPEITPVLSPVGSQEVWAAGVTYHRSRDARMKEASAAGGGDFYDRVYDAERPELFFKATAHRAVGHRQGVRIRGDSNWNVPEPELTLLISPSSRIIGYTIGNDMSSRDIEGENPLYLPQAKVYNQCAALGPGILITDEALPNTTEIRMKVTRSGKICFSGATRLSEMKRKPEELVAFLFRYNSFPNGCYLMTGTGVVPPDGFSLQSSDEIRISIDGIGTLVNFVT